MNLFGLILSCLLYSLKVPTTWNCFELHRGKYTQCGWHCDNCHLKSANLQLLSVLWWVDLFEIIKEEAKQKWIHTVFVLHSFACHDCPGTASGSALSAVQTLNTTSWKVGYELATNSIQFYVFANLVRHSWHTWKWIWLILKQSASACRNIKNQIMP